MNLLQKYEAHSSLQFGRLRSNRFGENRLTDACRVVFQKQAAPKSHAFLSCREPLPPSTRCGELRGGLSSRPAGAESLKHRNQPRRSRPAGSIGLCGGSYCWRPSFARGWVRAADCKSAATYDRLNPELQPKLQRKHKEAAPGNRCSLLNCAAQD